MAVKDKQGMTAANAMQPVAEPTMSARDKFRGGFSKRHPDIDMEDEEAYYGAVSKDYEDYDAAVKRNKDNDEANAHIVEMLEQNPAVAEVVYAMYNGSNPWKAMAAVFGEHITEIMKDPDNDDLAKAIIEGQNEYNERIKRSDDLQAQAEKNTKPSLDALAKVIEERGLGEKEQEAIVKLYSDIQEGAIVNKISYQTWNMLADAVTHDSDVAGASVEGEMRGKNARNTVERKRIAQGGNPISMRGQGGGPRSQQPSAAGLIGELAGQKPWYERDNEQEEV